MDINLLMPPIAFVIVLAAAGLLSFGMSRLSIRQRAGQEGMEPYSCGENIPTHMIQPDYGQFLPFAVFFTILHVVALTLATVPAVTPGAFAMAVLYLVGAVVGLLVLYRR
jgi:NADH-quinone oxidoreductase subunit A